MCPAYIPLGQAIQAVRKRRGWSPSQLAAAIHVHRSTIVRWESQTRHLLDHRLRDIAAALGVSPAFLYQLLPDDPVVQHLDPFPSSANDHQAPTTRERKHA